MSYLIVFFAGLFAANGVPHVIKGITGEQFQTPFKRPSSAVVNVLWGALNWLVVVVLMSLIANTHPNVGYMLLFLAGALLMALTLAWRWGKKR